MSTQALIRAVVAESLQFDANVEAISALDRIIALGWATRGNALGAAMVHAHAQDPEALYRAVLLVARNLVKRYRLNRSAAEKSPWRPFSNTCIPPARTAAGSARFTRKVVPSPHVPCAGARN